MNVIRSSWDRDPLKRPSFKKIVGDLEKQRAGWSANSMNSVAGPVSPRPLPPLPESSEDSSSIGSDAAYLYKAKALYGCKSSESPPNNVMLIFNFSAADTAAKDDSNEISFSKGEILDIVDKNGNWWEARKEDGTVGSTWYIHVHPHQFQFMSALNHCVVAPSNYLQII